MKILLLTVFFTAFLITGHGQGFGSPKQLIKDGRFAALLAYNYNNNIQFAEIGIVRGWRSNYNGSQPEMPGIETIYPYFSLSSEVQLASNPLICPKIGYHWVLSFVDVGLSMFDYTDFKKSRFGLRPEIGLSIGGVIGVLYGYNINQENNLFGLSNHNLSFKIIFGSGITKTYEKKVIK